MSTIYYFKRLYTTFDGYILLLALPDCDFFKNPRLYCTYGLKARLEFNISLLTLIQFGFSVANSFLYKCQWTLFKNLFY